MIVLFVVGAPGVGKTTAIRELLPNPIMVPKPKWTVSSDIVAAGHYNGNVFDGADTVPYNGVLEALQYWEICFSRKRLTIFDGDRFSHHSVKQWFDHRVDRLCAVYLFADDDTLAARRFKRGSNQYPSWIKGRVTKAVKFFETFNDGLAIDTVRNSQTEIVQLIKDFVKL